MNALTGSVTPLRTLVPNSTSLTPEELEEYARSIAPLPLKEPHQLRAWTNTLHFTPPATPPKPSSPRAVSAPTLVLSIRLGLLLRKDLRQTRKSGNNKMERQRFQTRQHTSKQASTSAIKIEWQLSHVFHGLQRLILQRGIFSELLI